MLLSRRAGTLTLLAVLLALLAPTLAATPAEAASGRVRGTVTGAKGDRAPTVRVAWFSADWTYLGARRATGGGYSLLLEPGTYHLQFTDTRPAYDVDKYAPADVTVTVTSGSTTVRNVRLRRGAAIGGVAEAGGRPAAGARIVAANKDRNSFETTANSVGEFALGGLPPGSYAVFTYDRSRVWAGESTYLPRLRPGQFKHTDIDLTTRAGRLVVDLDAGDQPYPGVAYVTAVSRGNGQFWTERASRGSVTFAGLYPGRYDLVVPGSGGYLGGTLPVDGRVRKGRTSFGSVALSQRGGALTGQVVDSKDPSRGLAPVSVTVYDGDGRALAGATTAADGSFVVGGQLETTAGLTLVAQPGGPTAPYLQGRSYCKFGSVTLAGLTVTAGQTTPVGTLALPHLAGTDQDPACNP